MFLNVLSWGRKDVNLFPQPRAEGSFRSRGLELLLDKLSGQKEAVLLDFGNGCSGSLEVLSKAAKKVVFAGLAERVSDIPLIGLVDQEVSKEPQEPHVLPTVTAEDDSNAKHIKKQKDVKKVGYQAVLCWDVFDYVPKDDLSTVAEQIAAVTEKGSYVHLMLGTLHRHSSIPSTYEFISPTEIKYRADLSKVVECPRHSLRAVTPLFKEFETAHLGLLRHGYYELLLRKTS